MEGTFVKPLSMIFGINRQKLLLRVFSFAIVLMPFSYGTKFIIGKEEMLWVAPTLILALLLFLIDVPSLKPAILVVLVLSSLASTVNGFICNEPDGSSFQVFYAALRESLRLGLNVAWFFVCVKYFKSSLPTVLKWLSIGVQLQLGITIYMGLGMFKLVPLPESLDMYLKYYIARQSLWYGDIFIPRFGGTFFESPPFGLYMFSTFLVLFMSYYKGIKNGWIITGLICSFIGAMISISDQIFLGMLLIIPWIIIRYVKSRLKWSKIWVLVIFVPLLMLVVGGFTYYETIKLTQKTSEIGSSTDVIGMSGAERHFHFQYGLDMLADKPGSIIFGVGPGRYGDYVAITDLFPNTVTMQFSPMELIVEYGIIGFSIMGLWLLSLYRKALTYYGFFGVCALSGLLLANIVQASWKWEAWFMAAAFIYSGAIRTHTMPDGNEIKKDRNDNKIPLGQSIQHADFIN